MSHAITDIRIIASIKIREHFALEGDYNVRNR